ncbi:hypothetical protein COW36_02200 [bacterium (Candidatus Blackallbacteria) CG17_big_fil_post_rev_8_21_14_2_50_48_46]|uniref:Uncharacterized protein n=1 Tax=bacterium (Candidatus Blackallbacteria) CG17_big_fil_post_rev_8_21_14_2_50_48_46 TaxID=2014261 RepID=A0A2M7G9W6_9BACT|nr:MAG: hypothetical protein COW64_13270 [bacterium (Candidatus Blackallbacteria) CG18_big_fil_WC_8_21_14_2_50_49_26]PIW18943.1 MAG: hypothetical protein COW36_02200 [bacterium (Candidatus Blackallbacteria) CG17_big_fil_post_rev_8_21_14_2_50_48_46]PIW44689.1 MAG: hypothetical protein COW20_23915 [bacterium (Candidatus Blackallbacteria) CG13_big_fil_rev_8_21_14_2_50_49_14]
MKFLLTGLMMTLNLIPTQPPRQDLQAPVMTAADNSPKPPEKVTFPSMVKTTSLAAPEPPELDEVSALLQAFQAENGDFTTASEKNKEPKATPSPESHRDDDHEDHKAWVVELKSKEAKGKRQIRIPETGEFKLVLEAGPHFEITDRDARDGEAKLQMPAATLKTWIHLEEAKNNSSLEVSDELYYVKDTLSKERKHHDDERAKQWFKLGLRPLPVPSDWYSPDGQAFVLRFKANQIKEFQMIWQKQRGEAPFPPGINRVGPEGGTVELPGVAKLELPAGALKQTTTIKISQLKEAPFKGIMEVPPNMYWSAHIIPPGYEFASPIVKIEPFQTQLLIPAKLSLELLDPAYYKVTSGLVSDFISENPENKYGNTKDLEGYDGIKTKININSFIYYAKVVDYSWLSDYYRYHLQIKPLFKVNQVPSSNPEYLHETKHFVYFIETEGDRRRTTKEELIKVRRFI